MISCFAGAVQASAAGLSGQVQPAAQTGRMQVLENPPADSELKVTVIDFGDEGWGDGAMIESNGHCLLMDTYIPACGDTLVDFLLENGYREFDIYLSHYHADHFGNIERLLYDYDFTISRLYLPEDSYMTTTPGDYEDNMNWFTYMDGEIRDSAAELNIPVTNLKGGDSFMVGDALVEVLYGPAFVREDHNRTYLNSNSLVTRVTGGGIRFLTCGDIEKEMERQTLDAGIDVKADLLKLNHHGGDTSNDPAFLAAVNPSFAYFDYNGDSPSNYAMDWANAGATNMMKTANVHSVRYNGTIVYTAKDGVITVRAERNVVPKVLLYRGGVHGGVCMTYQMFNNMQEPIITDQMKAAAAKAASGSALVPVVYR